MRHVLLSGAIATGTRGMDQAAPAARLVALAGRTLRVAPGVPRTSFGTVDLAAVAAAADEHLSVAAPTQKQPGRRLGRFGRACT
jgi:hypothetical protein